MKKSIFMAAVSLLGPGAVLAGSGAGDYVPMQVIQTMAPVFPREAIPYGLTDGEASVAISVDETGRLNDVLVTRYSYPGFADAAVSAIKRWQFKPAQVHGVACGATEELTFTFESTGIVVVDLNAQVYAAEMHFRIAPNSEAFAFCTLRQLDRIPTPITIVKPVYPARLAHSSQTVHVTVGFYIDPDGRVRMPAVSSATGQANQELAGAAVAAVSQWRFEPPISKGRRVLVYAQQDIAFKPAVAESAGP